MMTLSLLLLTNNLKESVKILICKQFYLENGEDENLDDDALLAELGVEEDDPYDHVKNLKEEILKLNNEAIRLKKAND